MFQHGRECYRRNANFVCYTFYKNILYVLTQYWFGFYSGFSGQPLYEPFIYQLYNIVFTGTPIVIYAVFDYQYPKQTFVESGNYHRYMIGLTNEFFTVKVFWGWMLYATLQSVCIYFFAFHFVEIASTYADQSGRAYDIWCAGQNVFFVCVFLVSFTLLKMHHQYNGWGEVWLALNAVAYFVVLLLESQFSMFP